MKPHRLSLRTRRAHSLPSYAPVTSGKSRDLAQDHQFGQGRCGASDPLYWPQLCPRVSLSFPFVCGDLSPTAVNRPPPWRWWQEGTQQSPSARPTRRPVLNKTESPGAAPFPRGRLGCLPSEPPSCSLRPAGTSACSFLSPAGSWEAYSVMAAFLLSCAPSLPRTKRRHRRKLLLMFLPSLHS